MGIHAVRHDGRFAAKNRGCHSAMKLSVNCMFPFRSGSMVCLIALLGYATSVNALENCTATFKKYFPKDCVDSPVPRPVPSKPPTTQPRIPPAASSSGGYMSGDSHARPAPSVPSYAAPSVSSGSRASDVLDVLNTAIELYQLMNKQPEPVVEEPSETADEILERIKAEEAAREREEAEEQAEADRLREQQKRREAATARPARHESAAYDSDDPFAPIDKEQAKTLREEVKDKFKDIGKEMVSFWDRAKDAWNHLTFRKDFDKKYLDKIENLADKAWDQD